MYETSTTEDDPLHRLGRIPCRENQGRTGENKRYGLGRTRSQTRLKGGRTCEGLTSVAVFTSTAAGGFSGIVACSLRTASLNQSTSPTSSFRCPSIPRSHLYAPSRLNFCWPRSVSSRPPEFHC